MTSSVFPSFPVFHDAKGKVLDGGYIYVGDADENPEVTPKAVYYDQDLSVPATQPIRTVAGRPSYNGSPAGIYTSGDYSLTVRDKNRNLVYSSLSVSTQFGSAFYSANGREDKGEIDSRSPADYPLSFDPVSASQMFVFVSGVGQITTEDFILVDMASAPSGKGIRFVGTYPDGAAYFIKYFQPSVGKSATDPGLIIMPGGLSIQAWCSYLSGGFEDRASLVTWWTGNSGGVPDGVITSDGTVSYVTDSTATDITALPGLTCYGDRQTAHHGCDLTGATDCATAFQEFQAAWDADRATKPANAIVTPGSYLLGSPITFTSNASVANFRCTLTWAGARFLCDFDRSSTNKRFISFFDPSTPTNSQSTVDIKGECEFERGPQCTHPPVAFYSSGFAQSAVRGIDIGSWSNSAIQLDGAQNVTIDDLTLFGTGYAVETTDLSGSLYRQTGTALSRVSGSDEFPTDCVGQTLLIKSANSFRKDKILARVSPTEVTVGNSNTDAVDKEVVLGGPTVTTTATSATMTINNGVVADEMVGLFVGVPRAGSNGKVLFGYITSVSSGLGGTITLDTAASTTLDPLGSPTTDNSELFTGAIVLNSALSAFFNGISQVHLENVQVETHSGCALLVDDAENVNMVNSKFHGRSSPTSTDYASAEIVANRLGGNFSNYTTDSLYIGAYRHWLADMTQMVSFYSYTGRMRSGEKLAALGLMPSGFENAGPRYLHFNPLIATPGETLMDLIDDENTSVQGWGGLLDERPDRDEGRLWLGRTAYVDRITNQAVMDGLSFDGTDFLDAFVDRTTYTPEFADAATGGTSVSGTGQYSRIGPLVFVTGRFVNIDTTGMTGGNTAYIRNLPVALAGGTSNISSATLRMSEVTFSGVPALFADDGDQQFVFYDTTSGGTSALLTVSAFASGTADVWFSAVYMTT